VPVTTGPGDERASVVRGRLRASHADREQVIEVLKAAFVQGRLTKDEFGARVGQALASLTYAELTAVTADIPAGPTGAQPPRKPARVQSRRPVNKAVKWGAKGFITPAIPAAAFAIFHLAGMGDVWVVAVPIALIYFLFWLSVGADLFWDWCRKRSGGRLPPRPAPSAGGQASGRPASAGPAGQLPQIDHGQQHTAEAARSDLAGPQSSGSRSLYRWRYRGHRYAIGYAGH